MKLCLITAACLLVLGCDDPKANKPTPPAPTLNQTGSMHLAYDSCSEVQMHRDPKHGVTCYVLLGCDGRGAISCLKVEE